MSVAENFGNPLVQQAWRRLQSHLGPEQVRLLSSSAVSALQRSLLQRLTRTGQQAIDFACCAFRTTSLLSSSSRRAISEAEWAKLLFSTGVEPQLEELFRHFPALEELWSAQLENWIEFVSEFLRHANAFVTGTLRRDVNRTGSIRRIIPDLADVRSGGRSVLRIGFAGGEDWVYKARPGAAERWFFRLLSEVNRAGFSRPLYLADIVEADTHHWMRFVPHRGCRGRKEVSDFYHRAGALLCLLHVVRGVDFHAGNLVAYGAQPVIVDCETLLHPSTRLPPEFAFEERSLFRTGMLPIPTSALDRSESVSALGRTAKGPHALIQNTRVVSAKEHLEELVDGFLEMHRLLVAAKADSRRLRRLLKHPSVVSCRIVRRPTGMYYRILKRSVAPEELITKSRRHSFLLHACRQANGHSSQLTREVGALKSGAIPTFRGRISQPRLLASSDLREAIQSIRAAFANSQSGDAGGR